MELLKVKDAAKYAYAVNGLSIHIGGKGDAADLFVPEIHISREEWNGFGQLTLRHQDASHATATKTVSSAANGAIAWVSTKGRSHTFSAESHEDLGNVLWHDLDYASFDCVPKDGIERFDIIQGKDELEWLYQPPLSEDEIKAGQVQYPEGIGSYAVYGKNRGKLCHILRPKLVDANGDVAWADLKLDGDKLLVELPIDWLRTAAYPVDPTFGYTSGYVTYLTNPTNSFALKNASYLYTASTGDTIDYIEVWCQGVTGGSYARATVALYTVASGNPSALITSGVTTNAKAAGYHRATFSQVMTNGVTYTLAVGVYDTDCDYFRLFYDAGDSGDSVSRADTTIPNPWGTATNQTYRIAVYAAYTAGTVYTGTTTVATGSTVSITGTFTAPTYSGSATTSTGTTVALAGVFTAPVYSATTQTATGTTAAFAGSFTVPDYSGVLATSTGSIGTMAGSFAVPVYSGTLTAATPTTPAIVGVHTPPTYEGSVVGSSGTTAAFAGSLGFLTGTVVTATPTTSSIIGTFIPPTYSGTVTGSTGSTASCAGVFTPPVYSATLAVAKGTTATFAAEVHEPILIGTVAASTSTSASLTGTFSWVHTGTFAASHGTTAAFTAHFSEPVYMAAASGHSGTSASMAGTFSVPVYSGIVSAATPTSCSLVGIFTAGPLGTISTATSTSVSMAGTFVGPTYSGVLATAIATAISAAGVYEAIPSAIVITSTSTTGVFTGAFTVPTYSGTLQTSTPSSVAFVGLRPSTNIFHYLLAL